MTDNAAQPETPSDESLAEALARYGVELPEDQIAALERYCRRLWDWNERLNLTRHIDFDKFVARDVVDSLAMAQTLEKRERVLDVGSGGGVPGVVLAIVRPDLRATLSESVAKKARALEQIVSEAGINATVFHGRAEDLLVRRRFDSLTIRAVAPLEKLLRWFAPHWPSIGRLLVIKGPAWVDERHECRERGLLRGKALRRLAEWPLPGRATSSVLLQIAPEEK